MDAVALRFSNVYGPFSAHKNNAIPNFITRCLRGEPLEIYGDGSQTRDFIHVDDLCEAITRSLSADGLAGEVLQLGTEVETSVLELVKLIQEATGATGEVVFRERRAGEVHRSRTEISKAKRMLGFAPSIELADGLARTTAWYRDHLGD
jgi:UDP-glucose 4-epimerase